MKRKSAIRREIEQLTGQPFDYVVCEVYGAVQSVEAVADKLELSRRIVIQTLQEAGIIKRQECHRAPDGRLIVDWLRDNGVTTVSTVTVVRRMKAGMPFHEAVFKQTKCQAARRRVLSRQAGA